MRMRKGGKLYQSGKVSMLETGLKANDTHKNFDFYCPGL